MRIVKEKLYLLFQAYFAVYQYDCIRYLCNLKMEREN